MDQKYGPHIRLSRSGKVPIHRTGIVGRSQIRSPIIGGLDAHRGSAATFFRHLPRYFGDGKLAVHVLPINSGVTARILERNDHQRSNPFGFDVPRVEATLESWPINALRLTSTIEETFG